MQPVAIWRLKGKSTKKHTFYFKCVRSANIRDLDKTAKNNNILLKTINKKDIQNIISNSFGFGGTNATLGFSKINA